MIFKTLQLLIDDKNPTELELNKIIHLGAQKHLMGSDIYLVDKKIINNRILWIYCQYDNAYLYGDVVYDTSKEIESKNTRKKTQVELRKQLFIAFDVKNKYLYLSDINKKGFLRNYLAETLQCEVVIKNIYASLQEFRQSVKYLKKLKFTQAYNVMNVATSDSIFLQQANALGLDMPNKITMQIEYGNTPVEKIQNGLEIIRNKRKQGFFEDVVLIGEDDEGIEQNFDFRSLIKNVEILINKNENERFDAEQIEKLFLERIDSLDV